MATRFENTARTIINTHKTLSLFVAMPYRSLAHENQQCQKQKKINKIKDSMTDYVQLKELSPESNTSREYEANAYSSGCACELESIPNAGDEICTQKDDSYKPNADKCKPHIVQN